MFKKEYLINFRADQPYSVGMDSMTQISSDRRNEIIQRSSSTIQCKRDLKKSFRDFSMFDKWAHIVLAYIVQTFSES